MLLQQAEAESDPVPYDISAARLFGRMSAAIGERGHPPRARTSDLMIAATSAVESLPLVTTNPHDHDGLEQLVDVVAAPRP